MSVGPGTHLGPYEILSAIGAGGMGEVYRARDTRLERDVALKILPESFATDPERLARFQREAEILAALNHPHIAAIHGLEEDRDTRALVMEFVEGEDLSQRIARGPIPLDEALPIARQIAEALEAAHEQGIIHRDLKPANIKVTPDGVVKVLDFGLAKLIESGSGIRDSGSGGAGALSMSPTITSPAMMTGVGVLLGTAAYMSPEQTKGREADKRSDIWAFGSVLYEMLTGRRPFDGEDMTDVLGAVVRLDPNWEALSSDVSPSVRTLLHGCLVKDRRKRIADIAAALFVLDYQASLTAAAGSAVPLSRKPLWRRAAVVVAACSALAAAMSAVVTLTVTRTLPPSRPSLRFSVEPSADQPLYSSPTQTMIGVAPDGKYMAYLANTGPVRNAFGSAQLMVRPLDKLESMSVPGVGSVREPFFSADSRWIAFFDSGEIKRVPVSGGALVTICAYTGEPRGGTWGSNNMIVFATTTSGGLVTVPIQGGTPKQITKAGSTAIIHGYPSFVEGSDTVLFTVVDSSNLTASQIQQAEVAAVDFKTGRQETLVKGGMSGVYLCPTRSFHRPLLPSRSRFVAAMRRTSTRRALVSPSRITSRS